MCQQLPPSTFVFGSVLHIGHFPKFQQILLKVLCLGEVCGRTSLPMLVWSNQGVITRMCAKDLGLPLVDVSQVSEGDELFEVIHGRLAK